MAVETFYKTIKFTIKILLICGMHSIESVLLMLIVENITPLLENRSTESITSRKRNMWRNSSDVSVLKYAMSRSFSKPSYLSNIAKNKLRANKTLNYYHKIFFFSWNWFEAYVGIQRKILWYYNDFLILKILSILQNVKISISILKDKTNLYWKEMCCLGAFFIG